MKRLLVALLVAVAGCRTQAARSLDDELTSYATAEGCTVRFREGEVDRRAAELVAAKIAEVRSAVAQELALVSTASESSPPPLAEVLLYRDAGWGQERWLVTHAVILERPLRVKIPCALPEDDKEGPEIVARIRGTVAHEIAEASVLTRVPILDPYLRWLHDGVAESVEYRVLLRVDPKAASETLARYDQYAREARRAADEWVDLTRWRQLPDWIVHSDVLFRDGPLRLDDIPGSLARIRDKRLPAQERDPETVLVLDQLVTLLGEAWAREVMPRHRGEADPHPKSGQFLHYDASFCFWLELERAHPGITAAAVAAIAARREAVLRSDDVVRILAGLSGEDPKARLERFTLDRLESILAAERRRAVVR